MYQKYYAAGGRADAYAAHHKIVQGLAGTHSWSLALEYDIKQRTAIAEDPRVDISQLHADQVTIILTDLAFSVSPPRYTPYNSMGFNAYANPGAKRARDTFTPMTRATGFDQLPRRPRLAGPSSSLCFRCGQTGHLPASCTATRTIAGRPVASLASTGGPHTLAAPNGTQYCFNWARASDCKFRDQCSNAHSCSICHSRDHGATECTHRK